MNLFTWNSPYYHLLKYLLFLLKYPVYFIVKRTRYINVLIYFTGVTLYMFRVRYPLYRRLGGPQGWSGRAENLDPNGIRSRTVQPIVSHYTDRATGPTRIYLLTVLPRNSEELYMPRDPTFTAELQTCASIRTAGYPDMQKTWIIGFFFGNILHWQFEVRLLLFTVCTGV